MCTIPITMPRYVMHMHNKATHSVISQKPTPWRHWHTDGTTHYNFPGFILVPLQSCCNKEMRHHTQLLLHRDLQIQEPMFFCESLQNIVTVHVLPSTQYQMSIDQFTGKCQGALLKTRYECRQKAHNREKAAMS